jgi:transcriptional regulator with XRE-family HTH domain
MAIGEELREARIQAALSQRELAATVGISASEISRIERGQSPHVAYETLVAIGAALGLDLPLRAYPNGDAVRDAASLALLARFRALLPAGLRHRTEVPLGIPGDRRAWDDVVDGPGWSLPVEAETRLRDVQALHRKLSLKCRDGKVDRMLLLVADTRHNRHVLRLAAAEFDAAFPVRGRDALAALRAGRCPDGSAVVLL